MLILARHGNTFSSSEEARWVGSWTDLPLVERGVEQAHQVATWLSAQGLMISEWISGPLRRTREFTELVMRELSPVAAVTIDPALDEIDYGLWEGLTSGQVAERFSQDVLDGWQSRFEWPSHGEWKPGKAALAERVAGFLGRMQKEVGAGRHVFACTSQGFLRMTRAVLEPGVAPSLGRTKTGHLCLLDFEKSWRIVSWDMAVRG